MATTVLRGKNWHLPPLSPPHPPLPTPTPRLPFLDVSSQSIAARIYDSLARQQELTLTHLNRKSTKRSLRRAEEKEGEEEEEEEEEEKEQD